MPRRLARSSSSFSRASAAGSGLGEPSSRNSAFFDRIADFSNVPPIPTPAMRGGHASGPAVLMHSSTQSLAPSRPSAGVSILYFDRFSQPPPLAMIWMRSPGPARGAPPGGGIFFFFRCSPPPPPFGLGGGAPPAPRHELGVDDAGGVVGGVH